MACGCFNLQYCSDQSGIIVSEVAVFMDKFDTLHSKLGAPENEFRVGILTFHGAAGEGCEVDAVRLTTGERYIAQGGNFHEATEALARMLDLEYGRQTGPGVGGETLRQGAAPPVR